MKRISILLRFLGFVFLLVVIYSGEAAVPNLAKHLRLRQPALFSDSVSATSPPRPLAGSLPRSLKAAYLAALEQASGPQMENIKIQTELLTQAAEIEGQARGALFPTISGVTTFLNQPSPSNAIGSTFSPASQNTVKITADQPLFRGLREYALLRQKKYLVDAQVQMLFNAALQLFYDVATAYYNVAAYQEDEGNYKLEILDSKTRLADLQGFYKIGRSQLTDVLTSQANIASLEAQLAATHGQLEIARDTLAIFTGWDRNLILNPGSSDSKEGEASPVQLAEISSYLAKIEQRPDVQLAIANVKANEEAIPISWGAHLPSVDLLGNYYFTRPGTLSDVKWDASVALTIPIYQGGVIQSQVRQAQSVVRQYGFILAQVRKTAEQEVRVFYDTLSANKNQLEKLGELLTISKKNYETEVKFYKNGLVTNLEVMQAMTTYTDAQRQFDHLNQLLKLAFAKLEASVGERPEINIKPDVKL